MRSTSLALGSWWIALFALYLVLADSVVVPELVTGAGVAALGAAGAVLVRRDRRLLLRPHLRWLRSAWRPLLGIFGDLRPLARALARRGRGSDYVEVPLAEAYAGDDPEAHAFRAFSETLGSLAPNTVVVAIDTDRRVAVAHQLEPDDRVASTALPLST